ncbi:transposase [Virgibacillus sp. 179-BFC.A HS]|uniref:Transposase n=1 Tax=Tigheibacillus jepli TaxID=3035914 RepID=A0ABU5CE93_9BACI|nr:transposase [Virgibacillus sp. 179-BFC.A HS]MDY0404172.1 transposase [Virgibacillus sp. 179-BFC.A HS]
MYSSNGAFQAKKAMGPGEPEKIEQEYIRYGTTTLIASRNVATGQVMASIGPTRKEKDLVFHINQVVAKDPEASYVFVMDQLNTHKSESLVRFVIEQCDIPQDTLGKKGRSGILKNKKSRVALDISFLGLVWPLPFPIPQKVRCHFFSYNHYKTSKSEQNQKSNKIGCKK